MWIARMLRVGKVGVNESSVYIICLLMYQQSYPLTKTHSIEIIQIKPITQATNYTFTCSVLYITMQGLYVGLYPLVAIVQWYNALYHQSATFCNTVHSILVLWQLPVALHIVHWVYRTVA